MTTYESAIIICLRASDPQRLVLRGSIERPCDDCGEFIAVAPATLELPLAKHPDTIFQCLECAMQNGYLDGSVPIAPPSATQRIERADNGHDPDDWPLRHLWEKH